MVQLRGYGMSADAHHITQPPRDGAGAALAMQRALENAGALPEQVVYVNAHGTGTPLGDAAELTAILKVFGSAGPAVQHSEKHRVHSLSVHYQSSQLLLGAVAVPCRTDMLEYLYWSLASGEGLGKTQACAQSRALKMLSESCTSCFAWEHEEMRSITVRWCANAAGQSLG